MAAVTQPRASGIPQPVSRIPQPRGPSRLASMQSQFQQREAAERQKRLAELAPARPTPAARPAAEPTPRATPAPSRQPAAARGRVGGSGAAGVSAGGRSAPSGGASVSAGGRSAPSTASSAAGGGKVRAMFQTRRAGTAASSGPASQTSPIGWDKSYPLDPIKKSGPARSSAPPPASTKPAAAPARARRPEPAAEPRRPAARAAPAPARPPPTAAKENTPPVPRPPPTDPSMAQCPICQRVFNKDRLEKHQAICEKSAKKKRKVFDPVKMRVKGTESEGYLRKIKNKKPEKEPPKPAKKDWRKQHEEFIRNIRAAKKAQQHLAAGGKLEDLPPPPPMDTSDYVQCPHCGRKFNEAAADRHIPKCASISSNKPAAGRAVGGVKKMAPRASAAARLRR